MIALDTNVISELMRPTPAEVVVAWFDAQRAADLAIPAVAVAELRYGVARLPHGARQRALSARLDVLLSDVLGGRVFAFDADAAAFYGELVASREQAGRPISAADAQIAATSLARGTALATRNTRDFAGTGVALVDPWAAA